MRASIKLSTTLIATTLCCALFSATSATSKETSEGKNFLYLYEGLYLNLDDKNFVDINIDAFHTSRSFRGKLSPELRQLLEKTSVKLDSYIKDQPSEIYLYCDKANVLQRLGNFDEALMTVNKSLAIKESAFALYRRASIYFDQQNYSGAIADTTKVLDLNPGSKFALLLRMRAYEKNNESIKSKEDQIAILEVAKRDIGKRKSQLEDEIESNKHGLTHIIFGDGFGPSALESWFYPWIFNQ